MIMRGSGHVTLVEEIKNAYTFWMGNMRERDNLEEFGVNGGILRWMIRE